LPLATLDYIVDSVLCDSDVTSFENNVGYYGGEVSFIGCSEHAAATKIISEIDKHVSTKINHAELLLILENLDISGAHFYHEISYGRVISEEFVCSEMVASDILSMLGESLREDFMWQ